MMGGSARDDAVVVSREALHLHQRLTATVRAAGEVGMLRAPAVEGRDRRLGDLRHHVDAAVAVVRHLLGMSEGPAGIGCPAGMPRVRWKPWRTPGGRPIPWPRRSFVLRILRCPGHETCRSSRSSASRLRSRSRSPRCGVARTATLQNGGSVLKSEGSPCSQGGRPGGGVNSPASTVFAAVTFACGSASCSSRGHASAAAGAAWPGDPSDETITAVSTLPMPTPFAGPRAAALGAPRLERTHARAQRIERRSGDNASGGGECST